LDLIKSDLEYKYAGCGAVSIKITFESGGNMKKRIFFIFPILLFLVIGCSSQPITPERSLTGYESEEYTFQLALAMVAQWNGDPRIIPTDVPVMNLIGPRRFSIFASVALAAFDVYYEPSDWDDWVVKAKLVRGAQSYEPSDWDDWLVSNPEEDISRFVKASLAGNWLQAASKKIDPDNYYEPSDWDDWLVSGSYEPSDWDDWLVTATINDLINLN